MKYGSFYQEFKQEKGLTWILHYPIQGIRCIEYAISQLCLNKDQNLQFSLNSFFSMIIIIYLILFRPFKEKIILISNIVVESLILIIFVLMFMRIYSQTFKDDQIFDICFVSLILFLLGFQYMICLWMLLLRLKKMIEERRKKAGEIEKVDL